MSKIIKLSILIMLSLSVNIIYNYTNNSKYTITSIGDKLSIGNNNYIDHYKEYMSKEKKKVLLNNNYTKKNQTISNILFLVKENPNIKRDLIESNILIITLGYNDLLYGLCNEEEINDKTIDKVIKDINKDYNELINEITKYYHKEIIIVGYYKNNNKEINKGIIKLNKVLKNNKKIQYIDTYNTLLNRDKYFSKINNSKLNDLGYYEISNKIISKTLEIY